MFTGTVKLAQIDDYINPGQNCIQPKIMKQDLQPQKATVSLNDCLACSGCITSAQSVLIQQMSITKLLDLLQQDESRELIVMIAPQVVISLAVKYEKTPQTIFQHLSHFLRNKLKAAMVLDLWEGIELAHELQFREFEVRKNQTVLCSECPGWICYAQKTLNEKIVKLLSRVKSSQQVLARIVKQKFPKSLVLSIMPCYDKKLQAIRFEIQEGIKQVDITITTTQFLQLYEKISERQLQNAELSSEESIKVDRLIYQEIPFGFVPDQVSNGHIEALLARMGATVIKQSELKNADFIEIEAKYEGNNIKMAKCYGFRNIQRIVQQIKKNKCEYRYVEVMACPGGCHSGGGQPKFPNMKPKQLSQKCTQISSHLTNKARMPMNKQVQENEQQFKATYKVIEKTLTQAVMNW